MDTKRNIFLYWIGNEYKLINILRDSIYIHSKNGVGYTVHLITHKNINNYIKSLPKYFFTLLPAHQADFVRVNVICDYGGIWLDSDTLVVDSLDSLFDLFKQYDGFFILENNNILWNGVFGSKPNTPLMKTWKNIMINILDNKQKNINWAEIGCDLLEKLDKSYYTNYKIFKGLDSLYPVNWEFCVREFIEKPYDNYKNLTRNYQPIVVLVNSVYKNLEKMSTEEILNSKMPLNYFIHKSYEDGVKCIKEQKSRQLNSNIKSESKNNDNEISIKYDKLFLIFIIILILLILLSYVKKRNIVNNK